MANLRELLQVGFGQPLDSEVSVARRALTAKERRRVHKLVRRGEPAWDVPSARYALQVSRTTERAPSLFGPRGNRITMFVISAVSAALAWSEWSDSGVPLEGIFYGLSAIFWLGMGVFTNRWIASAAVARQANAALLASASAPGDRPRPHGAATPADGAAAATSVNASAGLAHSSAAQAGSSPSRWVERAGLALAIGLAAVLFGGGMWLGDGGTNGGSIGAVVAGLIFGGLFVPAMRAVAKQVQTSPLADDHPGPLPPVQGLATPLWQGLSPRTRRTLRILGLASALFFLWVFAMVQTQLPTCDTASGGLPSGSQVGFTRAFCGTPNASTGSIAEAYALVGALPIVGLLLALFGIGWRSDRRRWTLVGIGTALIVVPVALAWLIAGAH